MASDSEDSGREPISPIPKRTTTMIQLKRENAELRAQIEQLVAQNRQQQAKIEELEKASQTRHSETMSCLNQLLNTKNQDRMETEEPTTSGAKRPASPNANDEAKKVPKTNPKPVPPTQGPTTQGKGGQTSQPTTTQQQPKDKEQPRPKIPPVVLRKQERWGIVSKHLADQKINFAKAKLVKGSVQIEPQSEDDHRKLTRFLAATKEEYHTYSLPEARHLRVVIRGIPDGVQNEEIQEDLQSQGYHPAEVQRMKSRRSKQVLPLVLIKLPASEDSVLRVTRCCSLVVKVERQHEQTRVAQCFRCQSFGHAQRNCAAEHRCVKCGAAHATATCSKKPDVPAKCANCGGAHPASYKGCPRYPKAAPKRAPQSAAKTPPTPKPVAAPAARTPAPQGVSASRSFADATKAGSRKRAPKPEAQLAPTTAAGLTAAFAQMQQMCSAMSAFLASFPASVRG